MPRPLLVIIIALVGGPALGGTDVRAQVPIEIRVSDAALETALDQVRTQTNLDLIYADRLVRDRTTSCTYDGSDRAAALECVLDGTGVRAERVRRGQYVLVVASPEQNEENTSRVPLNGYVLDAETGERLPGAHVHLTELTAGATTNQDGYFVVPNLPPEAYEVRISYLGYQSVDTTLTAGQDPVRIALAETPIESEGVVVEAGSTRPSLGEPDLFRALQWTPGIRKSGVTSGGLSVRGGNPDQNLYLLDGAPVYHPWHAFSLISTFQTKTLHSTDLYRGTFPVEYGGRLSSVLDAQMKDGSRQAPKAAAALSVLSGRFRIETPLTPSTSFMLSGRRSYLDRLIGRQHPVTGTNGRRDTLRTGYYFFDTSAKLTHRFGETHRLSLSYYHGRDDLDLRLPFDLSLDFSSWLRPADLLFEVAQNWDNTTTASLSSDYRVRLSDAGLKMHVDYHHSVSHVLAGGVQVSALQFESTLGSELQRSGGTSTRQAQESRLNAVKVAGYLQDTWTPTPQWTVEPGVRASYFSDGNHVHLAPRLNAQYVVHPRWLALEGSAGIHVQYLHRLRDRHSLVYDLVSSRWVPSSDRVQPAVGGQVGFGTQTQLQPGWSLEVGAYARETRNTLVPADAFQEKDDIEGPGIKVGALLGQYVTATERAFGLEFSTVFEQPPWRTRFVVSTGRTFVRTPSRQPSGLRWRPSSLDVPLSMRTTLGWEGGAWNATIAAEWRSGYPTTVPVARYRLGDPTETAPTTYLHRPRVNNGRLPPYLRMDLTVGYRFQLLSADWTATLNVYNATGRNNILDQTYQPTDTGVNVNRQRGLPILPLLELEMEL
ncbi:MAG: TonB-dependent receptor [Bacteroidetes bacterium QH_6_64_77]|nr:MAG: TonB-dependent receptor [Bacteroidetes bacterium QH_6_64_77]